MLCNVTCYKQLLLVPTLRRIKNQATKCRGSLGSSAMGELQEVKMKMRQKPLQELCQVLAFLAVN